MRGWRAGRVAARTVTIRCDCLTVCACLCVGACVRCSYMAMKHSALGFDALLQPGSSSAKGMFLNFRKNVRAPAPSTHTL